MDRAWGEWTDAQWAAWRAGGDAKEIAARRGASAVKFLLALDDEEIVALVARAVRAVER